MVESKTLQEIAELLMKDHIGRPSRKRKTVVVKDQLQMMRLSNSDEESWHLFLHFGNKAANFKLSTEEAITLIQSNLKSNITIKIRPSFEQEFHEVKRR